MKLLQGHVDANHFQRYPKSSTVHRCIHEMGEFPTILNTQVFTYFYLGVDPDIDAISGYISSKEFKNKVASKDIFV